MSQWLAKYTPEQRRAVAVACVDGVPGIKGRGKDGGCSAQQAVDLAREGLLPDMPAFEFALSTARHYAQELRRERAELERQKDTNTVDGLLDDLGHRLAMIADREVTRLERSRQRNRGSIEDARKVAQLVKEVRFAVTRPGKGAGSGAGQDDKPDTGPTGLVARLAAEQAGSAAVPDEPSPTARLDGETATETTTDTSPTGHGRTDTDTGQETEPRGIGVPGSVGESSGLAAAQALLAQASTVAR